MFLSYPPFYNYVIVIRPGFLGGEPAGMARVYLDYQSTTPLDPEVFSVMQRAFMEEFGNSASNHCYGSAAKALLDDARAVVASFIGADAREVIFTSGATESNNLALKGIAASSSRRHIVASAIEHKAVLDPLQRLERDGFEVTYVSVDRDGVVDIDQMRDSLRRDTLIVSLMLANNEIGTLQPVSAVSEAAHAVGALMHCDAAQAVGRVDIDVLALGVDLLSLSAHKFYGPKGVGALYVKRAVQDRLEPLFDGGGQERGLRSGTVNVPGCVGMAAACSLAQSRMREDVTTIGALTELLRTRLELIPGASVNGPRDNRLPGNINIRFAGVDADALILCCSDVAMSTGSACSSSTPGPSHVLRAIGLSEDEARESVRLSIGRLTAKEDVDYAASRLEDAVTEVRNRSSLEQAR